MSPQSQIIDAQLKAVLVEKIRLAQADLTSDPLLKVKLEDRGRKTSLHGGEKRPQNALLLLVQRKLRKNRLWKSIQAALVEIAFVDLVRELERKHGAVAAKEEISAARELQLTLFPGLESLPTRIRKGRTFLKFPDASVPQFLDYASKYEKRSQRDQKTADELRRLAKAVEPYAETDLTVATAFERAQQNAAAKIVMMPALG